MTDIDQKDSSGKSIDENSRPAFRRFARALHAVSQSLNLTPEPLPEQISSPFTPALAHLERRLFAPQAAPLDADNETTAVTLVETQNRTEEVRAALRWLKARLVRDSMAPSEVALIARSLTPYRPFIEETAAEFGLTLYLREGLNLTANPAITALMTLLALPLQNHPDGDWARICQYCWLLKFSSVLVPTPGPLAVMRVLAG